MALGFFPATDIERWLWHLDEELNIPAGLAATQLSIVALVAFATALRARTLPIWQRLYFGCMSALFVYLAHDEFFQSANRKWPGWEMHYAALGAVAALATLFVAARTASLGRIWHILFLFGLGISGFGALVVESLRFGCVELPIHVVGCIESSSYEEIFEFAGIWLTLVAMLGQFSLATRDPRLTGRWFIYLSPLISLVFLLLPFPVTYLEINHFSRPASVELEAGVKLEAYRIERQAGSVGLATFLASQSWHHYTGLGYSLHLVDQVSGASIAGVDKMTSRTYPWGTEFYTRDHNYRQWILLEISPETPRNRAYWIVLTYWRKQNGAYDRSPVASSDLQLLGKSQIIVGELALPTESAESTGQPLVQFGDAFTLGQVDLPQSAHPGENLGINFSWSSAANGEDDLIQFLHLGQEVGGEWFVYDQQPLGARLPTRLWYAGLADSEKWQVPLPAELAPGRYLVFTGLYRASDNVRLAAQSGGGGGGGRPTSKTGVYRWVRY